MRNKIVAKVHVYRGLGGTSYAKHQKFPSLTLPYGNTLKTPHSYLGCFGFSKTHVFGKVLNYFNLSILRNFFFCRTGKRSTFMRTILKISI